MLSAWALRGLHLHSLGLVALGFSVLGITRLVCVAVAGRVCVDRVAVWPSGLSRNRELLGFGLGMVPGLRGSFGG